MGTVGVAFERATGVDEERIARCPEPQPIADIVREAAEAALHPAWHALRMADRCGHDLRIVRPAGQQPSPRRRPGRGVGPRWKRRAGG